MSCLIWGKNGQQDRRWFLQRAPLRLVIILVISLGTSHATSHITDTISVEVSKDTPDATRHIQIRQAGGRASGWTLRVGPPMFRPQLSSGFRVIEWQPGVYATYWVGGDSS